MILLARPLAYIALVLLPVSVLAAGKERQFTRANCAITFPPEWESLVPWRDRPADLPADLLGVSETGDQHCILAIFFTDRGAVNGPLDRWFIDRVEQQCIHTNAGPKVSGRFIDFAGQACYERRGSFRSHGFEVATLVRAIPTGEGMYFLQATVLDSAAEDVPEVREALASFHFLHPPTRPAGSRGTRELAGLYLGRYGIPLLLFGALLLFVLAVVGFALRLRRHARLAAFNPERVVDGEPPPLPPTPPDRPTGSYDY